MILMLTLTKWLLFTSVVNHAIYLSTIEMQYGKEEVHTVVVRVFQDDLQSALQHFRSDASPIPIDQMAESGDVIESYFQDSF